MAAADPSLTLVEFSASVSNRFGPSTLVNSPAPSSDFFLIASFSRSAIRLNESLILQAVLGGVARNSRVVHQTDWVFRFSVASKNVGIMVHHLSKFA